MHATMQSTLRRIALTTALTSLPPPAIRPSLSFASTATTLDQFPLKPRTDMHIPVVGNMSDSPAVHYTPFHSSLSLHLRRSFSHLAVVVLLHFLPVVQHQSSPVVSLPHLYHHDHHSPFRCISTSSACAFLSTSLCTSYPFSITLLEAREPH